MAVSCVYSTNGSGRRFTYYSYNWYTGTAQLQSETVKAPLISSAENGPGSYDITTTLFDGYGNAQWIQDPDGYIEEDAYDPVTGALVTRIVDDSTNLPVGWTALSGSHLNLTTTYVVDALGRTTEETSPGGNITYYVYLDPQHEERIYQGWNAGSGGSPPSVTAPTQVIRHDATDDYDETFTMTATPSAPNGVPDGTETISGLQTLTRDYTNAAGQVIYEDAYFNFGTLTYDTLSQAQVNANYYQTSYGYDSDGRLVQTVTPNGTIYGSAYNSLDEKVSAWVGTTAANMVEVASYAYDIDGNQIQEIDYPGLSEPNRETDSWYDWRDRLVAQKSGVESQQIEQTDGVNRPIVVYTYDNLNEVTETQQYDGDGVTPVINNGVLQPLSSSLLRSQEIDNYDDQGRVYQTLVYDVNPSTGAVSSSALTTNDYYDHRGDLIAEADPGGEWTQSVYDGAGRDVMDYTTDGSGGTTWAEADSVANDTVLEQDQTNYDNDGNVIETIDSQRFDDVSGYGPLGTPTSGIEARVSYEASYYDNADRLTASVDVGTDAGTAWQRPSDVPNSSADVLVTKDAYNSMGLVQEVTDPQDLNTYTLYDNLGRTTETIDDYTNGVETADSNIATQYGYDGDNNVTYVRADEPGGSYQETDYLYGDSTAAGDGVNSNDIQSATEDPDPNTGQPSSSQEVSDLVNALGEVVQSTDRNGTVHQYTYDVLGRETSDAVTTLGTGVNGDVRRIEYAYDSQGNQDLVTTFDAASGGNIVNQVEDVYDGLDQLTGEYQSHSSQVNTSSTPEIQYNYAELTDGNNSRLTSVTYPDKYVLSYNYASGLDNNISRLSSLSDIENDLPVTLESYQYLGLDTVVERDHPQIKVNQTYITTQKGKTGDAGDPYVGLDRFGRVADQNWYDTSTSLSTDDFTYSYDQDGDVLSKQDSVEASMDETYQYDPLHRLTNFQRDTGDSQSWTLDALGNMPSVTTDDNPDSRMSNQENEITSEDGLALTYDKNGNMTVDDNGNDLTYDAWNHLVQLYKPASDITVNYRYDGLGRLITIVNSSVALTIDQYYSSSGQVLEEYYNGVPQARNVWSPVYVNALVLRDFSTGGNGTLDTRLYVEQDANWNVTALVDTTGTVQERFSYDPYGAVTDLDANYSPTGFDPYGMPYLWQGMEMDLQTEVQTEQQELYFGQNGRVESTQLMDWLQTDPSGLSAGDDEYEAMGDAPTNKVDPSGLDASWLSTLGWAITNPWQTTKIVAGSVVGDVINGGKALVTGDAGAALGEKAVAIVENSSGQQYQGTAGQNLSVAKEIGLQLIGVTPLAEGVAGADAATGNQLSGVERAQRSANGVASYAGSAAGAAGVVRMVAPTTNVVVTTRGITTVQTAVPTFSGLPGFGSALVAPNAAKAKMASLSDNGFGQPYGTPAPISLPEGKIGLSSLSEVEAASILQEIEAANMAAGVNSHFFSKHGAQTTLLQQARRARFGTLPDGSPGNPAPASRFLTHQGQLSAFLRAMEDSKLPGHGPNTPLFYDRIIGEGYLQGGGKGNYVVTGGAVYVFRQGRLLTLYPLVR